MALQILAAELQLASALYASIYNQSPETLLNVIINGHAKQPLPNQREIPANRRGIPAADVGAQTKPVDVGASRPILAEASTLTNYDHI